MVAHWATATVRPVMDRILIVNYTGPEASNGWFYLAFPSGHSNRDIHAITYITSHMHMDTKSDVVIPLCESEHLA